MLRQERGIPPAFLHRFDRAVPRGSRVHEKRVAPEFAQGLLHFPASAGNQGFREEPAIPEV
jgi:hypothetical protein